MSFESESSLVTSDALIRKALEDLLKCGLGNTILLNAQSALLYLELAEEPADSLIFFGNAQFEEFATLLKDLNLLEMPCQVGQDAEAVRLGLEELKEVAEAHFAIVIVARLCNQVVTQAIISDLVQDQVIEACACTLLDGSLQFNLRR